MPFSVDVLICGHNDAGHIGRALSSLERQTAAAGQFRVIVVDNSSTDDTTAVVQSFAHSLDLTCLVEPRLGLNYARNTGHVHSRADYVAHLDADAAADPEWLEHIQAVLNQLHPELCGGPYFPYYVQPKPDWFQDSYNSNDLGPQARWLGADEYLSGTNMIWRREFVKQLGGFTANFGLVGRGLARGDETELIARARHADPAFRAFYDPGIRVYHLTRPETFSMVYWLRRYFSQGYNHTGVFDQGRRPSIGLRLRFLARAARVLLTAPLQLLHGLTLRDRRRYPYFTNFLYEQFLPRAAVIGQAYQAWLPAQAR